MRSMAIHTTAEKRLYGVRIASIAYIFLTLRKKTGVGFAVTTVACLLHPATSARVAKEEKMTPNEHDTQGKYCPFNGFTPPCDVCMWSFEDASKSLICGINLIAQESAVNLSKTVYTDTIKSIT